jgi:multidrug efflux pump
MPLAVSNGAGSGGQNAIGTGVVGGMLSATILAIFFVPAFFVLVLGLFRVKPIAAEAAEPAPAADKTNHDKDGRDRRHAHPQPAE